MSSPIVGSLWTVRASSNPRAIWRVDAIDGDRYTLTLVRVDRVNFRRDKLGQSMVVDREWFRGSGIEFGPGT